MAMKYVIGVMVLLAVGHASVIYNNLDSATDFFDGVCVPGSDPCFGPLADSFTTPADGNTVLNRVGVLLRDSGTGGGQTTVELLSDDGGKPGSDVLRLGTVNDSELSSSFADFFFSTAFPLVPGTRYWIKLFDSSAPGISTSADWAVCITSCQNALGVPGEFFANGNNTAPCEGFPCVFPNRFGPYQMEVDVTTVTRGSTPELSGFLLLISGLVTTRLLGRRER